MITAIQWRGLSDPRVKQASDITWETLPDWLAELAEGVTTKAGCKCYSLVTLYDGAAGRGRKNTSLVHVVSLDFDAGAPPWGALAPYAYVAYTSPSHTVAAPRWRVHVRLAEPCPAGDYGATVRALLEMLGSPDVDSGASCDPARLWFSPLEDSDVRINEGEAWGVTKFYDVARQAAAELPTGQLAGPAPIAAEWPVDAVAAHVASAWGPGARHPMARALGGYLARRGWTDDAILAVIAEQESSEPEKRQAYALAAAERVRAGESAPGWDELVRMFGDVWADRLASLARHESEPADWAQSGVPWSAWWARAYARLDAALARGRERDRVERAAEPPLIIGYRQDWFVRDDHAGGTSYRAAVPKDNLVMVLRHAGTHYDEACAKAGKLLSSTYISQSWSTPAKSVEYRFADRGITWDAERQVVVVGRELPPIAPAFDADVDAWLHALFGAGYAAAEQWLAACAPRYISDVLTCCLVLIGRRGTGKSLLATALAQMWGRNSPVAMRDACAQFNAPILECPIVLDDEATWVQQGLMSSQEFLERIQQRDRSVEPKGRDKRALIGCQRSSITANDSTAIRFRDVRGVETVAAAQDRMAWHAAVDGDAALAALNRFRVGGTALVDLERLKGHLAWLWDTVRVDTMPRFVGAWDAEGARQAIMRDAAERYALVYDAVRDAVAAGPDKRPYGHAIIVPGGPIDLEVGTILVSATELEKGLRDGGRSQLAVWEVRRALEAVGARAGARHRIGGKDFSFWSLSASNLP